MELTPIEVRIDSYPGAPDASPDDYVIVFPADSGLPPLYVMFRDRREQSGVVEGYGQPDVADWLAGASEANGAAVPSRIANLLRGKSFNNWKTFRRHFWKAVYYDEILSKQMSVLNRIQIKSGRAPLADPDEYAGSSGSYEIHHIIPLHRGGKLYDLDNLVVTTPKFHKSIHTKEKV